MLGRWVEIKLGKGDERAARFGRFIAKEFGDEPLLSVATPETPVVSKVESVKVYPEISLEEEWQRQAQGLVGLGFHTELGLTEDDI